MKKWWQVIVLILFVVVLDQLTKWGMRDNFIVGESIKVIDGLFNLTYVRNRGAAFGFGAGQGDLFRALMFLLLPTIACVWLAFLIKTALIESKLLAVAYSMILAGAIGNLLDRFILNYVVDMFDFYLWQSHFPAFNIADASISVAAMLLIYDFFLQLKNKKGNGEA
ncbi:MAG: signal peptidase II [Bacteriovoracaceae bacterium]|nr:signal peptidase II [Bacteriovoracaceae bacterium]